MYFPKGGLSERKKTFLRRSCLRLVTESDSVFFVLFPVGTLSCLAACLAVPLPHL